MNYETITKQCLKEAHAECSITILPLGWNNFLTSPTAELKTIEALYAEHCIDLTSQGWNLDFLEYLQLQLQGRQDQLRFWDLFLLCPDLREIFHDQFRMLGKYLRCYGRELADIGYLDAYHHGTIIYFRRDLRLL